MTQTFTGTLADFLTTLRRELQARYEWARTDERKLDVWIALTRQTATSDRNEINLDGPAFRAAWRAVGGTGRPSFRGLRAIPQSGA